MGSQDPLHQEPMRPIVDGPGLLVNPIGRPPLIGLNDDRPMSYSDLAPSATCISPGFEYLTDKKRLPARVRGGLRLVSFRARVRHGTPQRLAGEEGGVGDEPHHGGHIVAVSLGGFASGRNLFPQARNFNLSAFARLEHSGQPRHSSSSPTGKAAPKRPSPS